MADTSLDSLSIVLRASAKEATDAIDAIIDSLSTLNGALNNFRADSPYMKGLNNLASGLKSVRISLNGLDAKNIQDVSKALDKLASAGERLSSLTGIMPAGTASQMTQIVSASDKAIKMAEDLGKKLHFDKERDGVERLAEGIENLSASMGDDSAVRSAMQNIDNILEKYGRWKNEMQDFHKTQLEVVRTANIKLGHGAQEALGGDYETARRNRGSMGIANTSKNGTSVSAIVDENAILGIEKEANEIDQLNQVMERTKEAAEGAKREFVSFHEADVTLTGGLEGLQAETNAIAESLGIVASKAREAEDVLDDDFMSIDTSDVDIWDDPVVSIQKLRDTAQETVPAVEALSQAENHLTENVDQMAQVGNIFQGISTGLESLQNVTLSDSLKNLEYVKSAISKFGNEAAGRAAANIQNLGNALGNFQFEMPRNWSDLVALSNTLGRFGGKAQGRTSENLIQIQAALQMFKGFTIDDGTVATIQQLGDALYKFGLAKMEKAMVNIPQMAEGMKKLIASLSNAPQVSENTIRLVTALGNMNLRSGNLTKNLGGVNKGLKNYRSHALNAHKASQSLASAFGKMYANFFIFFRLINRFKKDIDLASQLTEVQNVVDVTFAQAADKMNDFAKSAIDSLGMSELTAKQVGSRFQAMGKAMTITPAMVKGTNEFVQTATNGYANVANSMADVSINLTRLAGDMASFYNADYADVAKDLESVMTGLTKPLRKYGLDLTVATLEEWAMRNGMEANMKTMTQAEKTLLRYQYVMANTTAAHGDFIRTQSTWANQVRLATEKLNQLRIVLGKIAIYTFKPLVQNFNKAMEQILKGAEGLLNSLGKIFGWQIEWSDAGVLGDEADDAEELADNMGDAADNAKKFKNFLLGIDELNLLPDDSDKDKGAGGGAGDLTGDLSKLGEFNIKPVEKQFDSLYDTLYKLGKRINEVIKNLLQSIDWDKVYKKARRFGRGLAEFVNGLWSDAETFYELGKFFAGGVNTIAHALDAYHREFNGYQRSVGIGNLINGFVENIDWSVIKSAAYEIAHDFAQEVNALFHTIDWNGVGATLAEGLNTALIYLYTIADEIDWALVGDGIADGINGFFETFDFGKLAETINKWATGITTFLYRAFAGVNWNQVGKKIGEFFKKLNVTKIAAELGKVFLKVIGAAVDVFTSAAATAPLETAIVTAFGLVKSGAIAPIFTKLFGEALKGVDIKWVGGELSSILSRAALGIGAGLVEFTAVKDTFKDLYLGVEDVGTALLKIIPTATAAGAIMSSVFGFPAGAIAAGVIGITGELVGITEALVEMQREADRIQLGEILSNGGATVSDYFKDASNGMREAYDKYDKMARRVEETDLSGLKDNIARDMQEIGLSIDTLSTALGNNEVTVEQKLDEIFKLFDNFKNDLSKLFSSEIALLEEGAMNGLIDDVAELEAVANNMDLNMQKQIDEIKGKMEEATNLFQQNKVPYAEYEGMMQNYWKELNKIYSATANAGVSELEKTASVIDFSKLFLGEEDVNGVQASLEEFGVIYQNAINDLNTGYEGIFDTLTTLGEQASAMGDDVAAGQVAKSIVKAQEKEVGLIEEANNAYVSKIEELENQAYAQLGVILSNPEHLSQSDLQYQVQEYVNNVIDPLENAIKTETGRVGIEWGSNMSDLAHRLMEEMQGSLGGMGMDGEFYGTDLFRLWEERFSHAALTAEKSIKNLSSEQSTAEKVAIKFAESQGHFSKIMEKANDTIKGGHDGDVEKVRNMVELKDKSVLATSGVIDFNKALGETKQSGEGIKDVSTNMSGLSAVLSTFGTAFAPVKTGFMEFAEQSRSNMIATSAIFGQSFDKIKVYGNQTLSWFKSSFVPMFSGAYWQSLTASIPNAFGNAFKQATNIMVNIWKQFAQWANANMKINVNANGKKQSEIKVDVPTYSTGGFPEDGFFYANHSEMVGSFNNGKTAVANNEQIVEGIKQGVYEAMMAANGNGGSNVTVELRGDASDIFTAVVKENNRAIYRTGSSPIRN